MPIGRCGGILGYSDLVIRQFRMPDLGLDLVENWTSDQTLILKRAEYRTVGAIVDVQTQFAKVVRIEDSIIHKWCSYRQVSIYDRWLRGDIECLLGGHWFIIPSERPPAQSPLCYRMLLRKRTCYRMDYDPSHVSRY